MCTYVVRQDFDTTQFNFDISAALIRWLQCNKQKKTKLTKDNPRTNDKSEHYSQ